MFSSSVCSMPWRRRRRWYGGGGGAQNEGEKRFFDKGSLGPGAFAGDHLYLFFVYMRVCVCACVIRGHILNIISIGTYVLCFSCHFFPIPVGRGAAAAHISILRCYYYTTSKIPNPLKKRKRKNVSWRRPHVDAKQPRVRDYLYIYIDTYKRIYDRTTLRNSFCVSHGHGVWCFKTSSALYTRMYQLGLYRAPGPDLGVCWDRINN